MSRAAEARLGAAVALGFLFLAWSPRTFVGNPQRDALAYLQSPLFLFSVVGILALGYWICTVDRWLGAGVVWMACLAAITGTDLAVSNAHWLAIGAGALVLLRGVSPLWRERLRWALIITACVEVAYALLQTQRIDPLFVWNYGEPVGSFGNKRYLGAFMAAIAPLAPLWVLPVLAIGLILSQSWLATMAALIGLVVGHGHAKRGATEARVLPPRGWAAPLLMFGGGAVLGALVYTRGLRLDTFWARVDAWGLAWDTWCTWWMGCGPGGWLYHIPKAQLGRAPEMFLQAHSEPLQWVYETGLVGLVILIGWLYTMRKAVHPEWRGAIVAIGVMSLFLHVFRWPTLAPALLLIVGLGVDKSGDDRG